MKLKSLSNIGLGILSFLIVFIVFRLAGLVVDMGLWLIILLLILIYFEVMDINKKK